MFDVINVSNFMFFIFFVTYQTLFVGDHFQHFYFYGLWNKNKCSTFSLLACFALYFYKSLWKTPEFGYSFFQNKITLYEHLKSTGKSQFGLKLYETNSKIEIFKNIIRINDTFLYKINHNKRYKQGYKFVTIGYWLNL